MYPPVFETLKADPVVKSLLQEAAGKPVKIFPSDEVPQTTNAPYVAWTVVGGFPENYLGDNPDMDQFTSELAVYASKIKDCRTIAKAISDAIAGKGYITAWLGESKDPDTKLRLLSFDVDWHTPRN